MKKKMVWLMAAAAAAALWVPAETVITSPTGTPDESDVVLETTVEQVKNLPADTVEAVGDAVMYTADEARNAWHGVQSAFEGEKPRDAARRQGFAETDAAWDRTGDIQLRSYAVSAAVGEEINALGPEGASPVDARGFFPGVPFPKGASAWYRPDTRRLVVFNTPDNLLAAEDMLSRHHRAEREYKQVQIEAKFIEVSQSTLNQMGFTWRIENVIGDDGVRLFDDWQINDNQDLLSAGLRSAAGAFGGAPGAGSMVLTKSGWMPLRVVINALEQAGDSDVLSAPSLTTLDGRKAEIWVGEDREIPKSFNVGSEAVNVHIEHDDWDSELMGVHFAVTPELLPENRIRLELNPKVVDLIGYDSYQVSPEASMMMINGGWADRYMVRGKYPILNLPGEGISTAWNRISATLSSLYFPGSEIDSDNPTDYPEDIPDPNNPGTWGDGNNNNPNQGYTSDFRMYQHEEHGVPLAPIVGQLPSFRVREIKTQVKVNDGSTVGLGGLIYDRLETFKDKVPVLGSIPLVGRLFRSEGERSIKRNLMIFVTADRLDNSGQTRSELALQQQ